ncbi:anti-sigma factor family protein [Telluria sp. B2]
MNFSDETLMAYADGELDEPQRSAVERAMREDPQVAAAIERHRALRAKVFGAYAGVLDEPVPERLRPAPPPAPGVVSLDAVREARRQAAAAAATSGRPNAGRRPAWLQWGGIAASLVVGVLAGSAWLGGAGGDKTWVSADADGRLVAGAALAGALSDQLASAQPQGPVRIGTSFATKDGGYCRSFQLQGSAGLACREGDGWRIPVFEEGGAAGTEYRQAASEMPAAVLEAIDERIEGAALDAQAERAARERGWKR